MDAPGLFYDSTEKISLKNRLVLQEMLKVLLWPTSAGPVSPTGDRTFSLDGKSRQKDQGAALPAYPLTGFRGSRPEIPLRTRPHRTPPRERSGHPLQFPPLVPRKPWRVPSLPLHGAGPARFGRRSSHRAPPAATVGFPVMSSGKSRHLKQHGRDRRGTPRGCPIKKNIYFNFNTGISPTRFPD